MIFEIDPGDDLPLSVGLQQRVLAGYRAPFFDALAEKIVGGLGVFAGEPKKEEMIKTGVLHKARLTPAKNIHLLGGKFYLCWQKGIISWLNDFQPKALILEANPRYLSTPRAVRWMRSRHSPVVGWGLGAPGSIGLVSLLQRKARRTYFEQFDALVTYSQQGADEYRSLGYHPHRIFVAPNAVARRPKHGLPVRNENFDPAGPHLLFVGRLQPRKRVDLLLHACAALAPDFTPQLTIIGDGPARSQLEKLAAEIYPQARFLGAIHGEALEPYYRAADLFVLPGTGGLALQQAMSFALPLIAAEADGTQVDLVRSGNGFRVLPGDLGDLRLKLFQALLDPRRLRQMGCESFRIVSEEINLERMVDVFCDALRSVNALSMGGE